MNKFGGDNLNEELQIRGAVPEDVKDIMNIMDRVTRQLAQSSWFVPSDAAFVKTQVAGDGLVMVAENGRQEIVAAFIVCFPGNQEENLGYDLHLPERERLKVAHMETVIVQPRYRGSGLQQRLVKAAEQELEKTRYRYLMCTVHPENHYSLNNMLFCGYRIMLTREKYGGVLRHVLCKTSQSWQAELPVILVSSCLLGVRCRYNGTGGEAGWLSDLSEHAILIPVCPEVMGGLPTPREPAERCGLRVITKSGADVTAAYEQGAALVLSLAQWYGSPCAVLKERSPSCGSRNIYDGTHSGRLIPGDGKTTELLKQQGIPVFGESKGEKLKDFLAQRGIL